jgi:hypothetical protein
MRAPRLPGRGALAYRGGAERRFPSRGWRPHRLPVGGRRPARRDGRRPRHAGSGIGWPRPGDPLRARPGPAGARSRRPRAGCAARKAQSHRRAASRPPGDAGGPRPLRAGRTRPCSAAAPGGGPGGVRQGAGDPSAAPGVRRLRARRAGALGTGEQRAARAPDAERRVSPDMEVPRASQHREPCLVHGVVLQLPQRAGHLPAPVRAARKTGKPRLRTAAGARRALDLRVGRGMDPRCAGTGDPLARHPGPGGRRVRLRGAAAVARTVGAAPCHRAGAGAFCAGPGRAVAGACVRRAASACGATRAPDHGPPARRRPRQLRSRTSVRTRSRNASRGIGSSCPSPLRRGATVPASASRGPTTIM